MQGAQGTEFDVGLRQIKRAFKKDVLPAFGAVKVSDLIEQHISNLLRKVVDRVRNRLAAMMLTDLRQMFLWAEQRKPWRRLLIGGNPAVLVNIETIVDPDYDLSNERDRVPCADEIHELAGIFTCMQREYEAAPIAAKPHVR